MAIEHYYLTDRMRRIVKNAELETRATGGVVNPEHLLIACFNEKKGALGEISLKVKVNKDSIREAVSSEKTVLNQIETSSPVFKLPVTTDVIKILDLAKRYMNKYNQIMINEGHLLKALIATKQIDNILTKEDKELILSIGTTARDMITYLGEYTFPHIKSDINLIRKTSEKDCPRVVSFVNDNFSSGWADTVENAFASFESPPLYIAEEKDGTIIGFAGFDIYKNKKCYFGPMGIVSANRTKGVGYSLLHHCLKDMKKTGYEYAIIGEVGPIEFYEKVCNATVIPSSHY